MNMALIGKTIALVTGANQGIGLAVLKILSFNYNYYVIMAGRWEQAVQEAAEQLRKKGLDVEPLVLNIGSDQSIDTAVNYVQRSVLLFIEYLLLAY